jgi:hypothetical protein
MGGTMSDDRFLDALRRDSASLQDSPDPHDPVWTRLPARVRDAIDAQPAGLAQVLAAWLRPLAASLAAVAIAATLGLGWLEWSSAADSGLGDAAAIEIGIAGDAYHVGD